MTDAEYLFLVIAAFYLAECTCWVRAGSFVFCCQLGWKRQRCLHLRWALLQNPEGGFLPGNLLPLGQASIAQQWPLSLSPQGAFSYVSQAFTRDGRPRQPERFIRYEDIERVETEGLNLHVNGVLFARAATPSFANLLTATISRLAQLPQNERAPAIEAALCHHLSVAHVVDRLGLFRRSCANLQITCCLLFFLVLLFPPFLVFIDSSFSLATLLASYAGLVWLAILQFRHAHLALYPDERLDRWKTVMMMLVSPADAMHARDKLAHPLLGDFCPLVVAKVLCRPDDFLRFAGDVWRDLEHPMLPVCPASDEAAQETEAWFRAQFRTQIGRFLVESGVNLDGLLQPPPRDDKFARSYCPRCLGQYVLQAGTCRDCGGRGLRGWG